MATGRLFYWPDNIKSFGKAQTTPVILGSGYEISIRDLAEMIARRTGFTGSIRWDASKPNGQPRRCLDVRRAECEFDFRAATSLEAGLAETIRWYQTQ